MIFLVVENTEHWNSVAIPVIAFKTKELAQKWISKQRNYPKYSIKPMKVIDKIF